MNNSTRACPQFLSRMTPMSNFLGTPKKTNLSGFSFPEKPAG
jgi:hypothetical protein